MTAHGSLETKHQGLWEQGRYLPRVSLSRAPSALILQHCRAQLEAGCVMGRNAGSAGRGSVQPAVHQLCEFGRVA